MKYLFTALLTLILSLPAVGQALYKVDYTQEDLVIFNDFCRKYKHKKDLPMNELVVEVGKYFLGTPYVNFTLEKKEPEELIVNLRELDCVTFVETTVALARCIKTGIYDFDYYCENLRDLRFRDGNLENFTSRLHYFSDWIWNNAEMGLVADQTGTFGGVDYPIKVNLMSRKPGNYRQLVNNPEYVPIIADIENNVISGRTMFEIPQESADSIASLMPGGFIVGTTTNWQMDVTHCGFLCHVDGKPYFMHASSTAKKVVITSESLQEYLESKRTMTGFMAVEVLNPEKPEPTIVRTDDGMLSNHIPLETRPIPIRSLQ